MHLKKTYQCPLQPCHFDDPSLDRLVRHLGKPVHGKSKPEVRRLTQSERSNWSFDLKKMRRTARERKLNNKDKKHRIRDIAKAQLIELKTNPPSKLIVSSAQLRGI